MNEKIAKAHTHIDANLVAQLIIDFGREFKGVYGMDTLASSLCAVGPLQSMLGNAIAKGIIQIGPASAAEPVKDEAREIIAELLRLADMGYEDSLKEPEENGNFAAYERAKRYLGLTIDT